MRKCAVPDWALESSVHELDWRRTGTPVPGGRPGLGTESFAGDLDWAGTGTGVTYGFIGLGLQSPECV